MRNKPVFFQSILAPLLNSRFSCVLITGASVVQVGLVSARLPAWQSPTHTAFGIPDPGCGLSRAIVALLRGDWRTSLTLHAFAPLFVLALCLIAITAILPQTPRNKIVTLVEYWERRTGLTTILLIGLVIYWLGRLLFMREAFLNLVAG